MTRDGKRSWKGNWKTTATAAGRVAAIVLGIVVATLAFGVGSLMVVARTDWGGERLRRVAVARANQSIRGQLDIGRLRFGGDRLVLSDLSLRDPEGRVAARVARVEVDFRIAPLLRKEVRVTHARIEAPHVTALSGPDGLNLARATEPRNKPAPKPPSPPSNLLDKEGWVVRLDDLLVSDGELSVASTTGKGAAAGDLREAIHISGLHVDLSARYAIGNGATDLLLSLTGKSLRAPTGPEALSAEVRRHPAGSHVAVDGALLGGSLRIRGDVVGPRADPAHTTLTASASLPRTKVAGFWWGPLRLEAAAAPDTTPRLDFLAAIPGLELTAVTAGPAPPPLPNKGTEPFTIEARLALSNLGTTGQAIERLMAGDLPALGGRGDLNVTIEGAATKSSTAPFAPWKARVKGLFERLRVADATILGLSIDGHATPLSMTTDDAALAVTVAAVESGATKLSRLHVDLRARDDDLTLAAGLMGPKAITLAADTRLDADRRGLALTRLSLVLPQATWASTQPARVRFDENGTSLRGLHLEADGGQLLSVDGATTPPSKTPARMNAHLEARVRLDLLPPPLLDPNLGVAGLLRAELTAAGEPAAPRASAQVRLEDGRFRRLSKIAAKLDATFTDRTLKGTLGVDAPAGAIDGSYSVPVDLLTSTAPLHVKVDATRIDLSAVLSGLGMQAPADGKLTARLQMDGSAGDPRADLVLDGLNLQARPPAGAAGSRTAAAVDVGRVHVSLSYARRVARAALDLEAAHGGRLRAAATTHVDLSYPAVTAPVDLQRLPIQGTLVARDFDVSWVSPFSARIESLKGLVTADARLAGTVGDPRVVGDVRWKNGQIVTVQTPSAKDGPEARAGTSARTGSFGAARGRAGSGRGGAGTNPGQ
jgi:autotransporter translocation and assembly factor TamB